MINIEILFSHEDFERALKWYIIAAKEKHLSKEDERVYHKLEILCESLKRDEEIENGED